MEFLNISDIKLKVTLTADEAARYGVDKYDDGRYGAKIRQSVREILAEAERECGFTVGSERILVQIYPLPSGVCELLVTRLSYVGRKDAAALSSADGVALMEHKRGIYRFPDAETLRLAVSAVGKTDTAADLYRDDYGRCYICVDEELTDGISDFEVFIEFGERLSALPIGVIAEYGTLLAKDNALGYVLSHMPREELE